jgi:uncharacterized peroxidase-related enzyme
MPRLNQINPAEAEGKTKELLDGIKKKSGMVPNILKHMANSEPALTGYLNFSGALANTSISAQLRELIALAVGEINGCHYCVAAHSAVAKLRGLSQDEIMDARRGTATDSKVDTAIKFAISIVENKGFVSDDEIEAMREAGYTDGEIVEVVAVVSLNIYTNYINHVAETIIDFPKVPELEEATA